ncbi:hypothetical protein ACFPRL_36405 [Pseudoclavibacter helvolus]
MALLRPWCTSRPAPRSGIRSTVMSPTRWNRNRKARYTGPGTRERGLTELRSGPTCSPSTKWKLCAPTALAYAATRTPKSDARLRHETPSRPS